MIHNYVQICVWLSGPELICVCVNKGSVTLQARRCLLSHKSVFLVKYGVISRAITSWFMHYMWAENSKIPRPMHISAQIKTKLITGHVTAR